jgi:hypothetical protein
VNKRKIAMATKINDKRVGYMCNINPGHTSSNWRICPPKAEVVSSNLAGSANDSARFPAILTRSG